MIVDDGADVEGRSFKLTDGVLAIGKAASPAGHIVAEKLQYAANASLNSRGTCSWVLADDASDITKTFE